MKTKLSRTTLTTFGLMLAAGLAYGYYRYLHRPATFPPNDPKNNAILIHLILAACSVVMVVAIHVYRKRKRLSSVWLAPFSRHALQRFKATIFPKPVTPLSVVRAIACVPLLVVVLWEPFRMAAQITASFDPSEPANAWGGPSYVGAALAHWMDCLILLYLGALMFHWLMVTVKPADAQ